MSNLKNIMLLAVAVYSSSVCGHPNKIKVMPIFSKIAKECNVPEKALYAIALTESNTLLTNGKLEPWPWTMNYRGKSYYYQDRINLYTAASSLVNKGERLFDVGIMQVNWRWHSDKSGSLWELTAPSTNIQIGCEILKTGFKTKRNWVDAAGFYHSPYNQKQAANYSKRFEKQLLRIE